mmetsp:Transcript_10209/g.24995  ORF Transcript_10209/g.24995 Transcript_10209/m.24995 type:complete len:257 (+) Transcript_10209:2198-2968(+)
MMTTLASSWGARTSGAGTAARTLRRPRSRRRPRRTLPLTQVGPKHRSRWSPRMPPRGHRAPTRPGQRGRRTRLPGGLTAYWLQLSYQKRLRRRTKMHRRITVRFRATRRPRGRAAPCPALLATARSMRTAARRWGAAASRACPGGIAPDRARSQMFSTSTIDLRPAIAMMLRRNRPWSWNVPRRGRRRRWRTRHRRTRTRRRYTTCWNPERAWARAARRLPAPIALSCLRKNRSHHRRRNPCIVSVGQQEYQSLCH